MNKFALSVLFAGCFSTAVLAATILSPNTNNGQGGNIPTGYSDLIFNLSNGNWVPNVNLPKTATNGDKITINSQAGYNSTLNATNTDLIDPTFKIVAGDSLIFTFNSTKKIWSFSPKTTFTPLTSGTTVPAFSDKVAQYVISPTDWAARIYLPAVAKDQQIIFIRSTSSQLSTIDSTNVLFPSTFTVQKNDQYAFRYDLATAKWLSVATPTRIVKPVTGNPAALKTALGALYGPKTEVRFSDSDWLPNLTLPAKARDRNRIIVTSTATQPVTIDNTYSNTTGTMKVSKGSRYEFMYVADSAQWILMSAPKPLFLGNEVATKFVTVQNPVTQINVDGKTWVPSVPLPATAQNGDRVIVANVAARNFTVTATGGLSQVMHKNDKVRFVYDNGAWKAESVIIDILLVDSPEVDVTLGATAAKLLMQEGLRVTNVAMGNSQANAYFRSVGYFNYKIPGATMNEVLGGGRTDVTLQNEVTRLGADAVHYQGAEPQANGCGIGYINSTPSKFNMISVSRIDCPEQVMGHELGHNMGLNHSFQRATDEAQRQIDIAAGIPRAPLDFNYGFEHPLVGTLLSYKFVPVRIAYYSSPKVYDPKYGLRIGVVDQVDEVRKINGNAVAMSNFRAAIN